MTQILKESCINVRFFGKKINKKKWKPKKTGFQLVKKKFQKKPGPQVISALNIDHPKRD